MKIISLFSSMVILLSMVACQSTRPKNKPAETEHITLEDKEDGFYYLNNTGDTLSTNSLQGKVVFINFWATWCGPCIKEMPAIQALAKKFENNDQVQFLLLDMDGDIKISKSFMEKNKYTLPYGVALSEIPGNWVGSAIPATIVLNKKNEVVFSHIGMAKYDDPKFIQFISEEAAL